MTIHSDWSRILHEECPAAFSKRPPIARMDIGIIDGHLQLMRLDTRMGTWECFIRNQFLKPIQTLFQQGCPRVVLCFDNYSAVPSYKSMTQLSRTGRHHQQEIKVFSAHDSLPSEIPEDPMLYLMNRNFKLKLIEMLCERIPVLVQLAQGQEFILDYKRVVSYTFTHPKIPVLVKDMEPMGESDVKFCRYVTKYGNALVHAIDGDYMAIALLYYTQHDLRDTNKIFIYRQLSVLQSTSSTVTAKNKRKRDADLVFFNPVEQEPAKRPKCWVNMQMLYAVVANAMRQSKYHESINPATGCFYTDRDAVFSAVYLMLCAGTDFSRNIPLLGPKRMWDALPLICAPLLQAVRGEPRLNERRFLNLVIARMYAINFKKHTAEINSMQGVLDSLHRSKLSDSTKQKLPSHERLVATLRNLNWVVEYWSMENGSVETPSDGQYGFAIDSTTGNMTFVDLAPSP